MDLATAQANYAAAQAAYTDALAAKSAGTAGRSVVRQDIDKLRAEMTHWSRVVAQISGGGPGYSVARWVR